MNRPVGSTVGSQTSDVARAVDVPVAGSNTNETGWSSRMIGDPATPFGAGLAGSGVVAGPSVSPGTRLARTLSPSQLEKYVAWSVVTGIAVASLPFQTYRSGPVEPSSGCAENASHLPSAE